MYVLLLEEWFWVMVECGGYTLGLSSVFLLNEPQVPFIGYYCFYFLLLALSIEYDELKSTYFESAVT